MEYTPKELISKADEIDENCYLDSEGVWHIDDDINIDVPKIIYMLKYSAGVITRCNIYIDAIRQFSKLDKASADALTKILTNILHEDDTKGNDK